MKTELFRYLPDLLNWVVLYHNGIEITWYPRTNDISIKRIEITPFHMIKLVDKELESTYYKAIRKCSIIIFRINEPTNF